MVFEQMGIFGKNKKIARTKKPKKTSKDSLIAQYQELYNLYYELYDTLNINLFITEEKLKINNIIVYPQEHTAELDGTQNLDVKERIRRHREWLNNESLTRIH